MEDKRKFWKTKRGVVMMKTTHDHSGAISLLGAYLSSIKNSKTLEEAQAFAVKAREGVTRATEAVDYAYLKIRELEPEEDPSDRLDQLEEFYDNVTGNHPQIAEMYPLN